MSLEGLLLWATVKVKALWCVLHALSPFSRSRNHLPLLFAAFLLCFRPLCELLVHDRVDYPMWRIGMASPRSLCHPAEGFELFEDRFGFAPCQIAHASVAPLDVAVGDALQLMGQDVVGDIGQPVVIVRQPQHAHIERTCAASAGTRAGSPQRAAPCPP